MQTKTLIITGGNRGIGLATLKLFQQQGWQIINLSRTPCNELNVINVRLNLENLTPEVTDKLLEEFQTILPSNSPICLVHNAGNFIKDNIMQIDPALTQQLFNVNVLAPMILNSIILPFMAPDSSIIYLGSTLSVKATPHTASYSTSKHAVIGLMRATCQDLAGKNIHTCCICPGPTETLMLQERFRQVPELEESLTNLSTFNRLVQPEELAELIWFCAMHPVINGSILHGNLGQRER